MLDIAGDKLNFKIMPFSYQGLNWLIITLIPESPYIKYIYSSMFYASILTALIVFVAISIWTRSIKHSLQPVYYLMDISENFSHCDLTQRAKIRKTDEVGKLACAFNNMAEEICLLINNLESKVRERTLELEKANTELNTAKAEIEIAAQLDFLTGLYNRRFMLAKLEEYVSNEKFKDNSLAVLLIDVDFFKKVNDTYGHDVGDMGLKVISQKLQETIRVGDIVARWGGEEFLIFANNSNRVGAEKLAERLRSEIQGTKIEYQNKEIFVTISLGIALNSFDIQNNVTLLIRRADEALYLAKSKGRNRFEMWTNTIEK
ncbi:GGDEF domain-containing protein [Succinispira mobilis]|uniref:GGDEF domain-containing protein n=1 Tax=Succinispira mobilis TaxID=78120 RepID=UPI000378D4B6|nr:GGDEF domain-containing protein [Succinispira mobilis]